MSKEEFFGKERLFKIEKPQENQENKESIDAEIKNLKDIKSIKQIKIEVLKIFNENKDNYSFKDYETELLSKYDIDGNINFHYLLKLIDYYEKNKKKINIKNEEDIYVKKIFKNIICLNFEDNKTIQKN